MNASFYQLLGSAVLRAALANPNSIEPSSLSNKTSWPSAIQQLLRVEQKTISEPNSNDLQQKIAPSNIAVMLELQSQLYAQAIRVELISKVAESASSTLKRLSQNAG